MIRAAALLAAFTCAPPPSPALPPRILAIEGSPDGRHVAVVREGGELAVLDLAEGGAWSILARWTTAGPAWSPSGSRLAFVERPPGAPPAIWLVDPDGARPERPLVDGYDWKGKLGWLDERRLLYLSDQDAEHVTLRAIDVIDGTHHVRLDPGFDVADFWVAPLSRDILYRSAQSGLPELWWLPAGSAEPIQLSRDAPGRALREHEAAFSLNAGAVAWAAQGLEEGEIVYFDLATRREIGRLNLALAPRRLLVDFDETVFAEVGDALFLWKPRREPHGPLRGPLQWEGLGLIGPARLGPARRGAALEGRWLVSVQDLERVDSPLVHARGLEDLLSLARRWQALGGGRASRELAEDLWRRHAADPAQRASIALTAAWIDQQQGRAGAADRWLGETIGLADPGGDLYPAAWTERVLLQFFDRERLDAARQTLAAAPATIRSRPVLIWVRELLRSEDEKLVKTWRQAGRAARGGDWARCGELILPLTSSSVVSALTRRGAALLLEGDLLPLRESGPFDDPSEATGPLASTALQQAALRLAAEDLSPEMGRGELRSLLLEHWARHGPLEAARNLIKLDLEDAAGATFDPTEVMSRYLEPEEQERWVERLVEEALLAPEIAPLLDQRMKDAESHLIFTLTRAKRAIVQGDRALLGEAVEQLRRDRALLPETFWRGDNTHLLLLVRLFEVKERERAEDWAEAAAGYAACEEVIERFPGDWGLIPFELAVARSVIEVGAPDPELLRTYLQVIRGLGDPLVNPAHEPPTLQAALTNLATLHRYAAEPWLAPFLYYTEALARGLLGRPYSALAALERLRSASAPTALRARGLMEEASLRQGLGQEAQAARLLAELADLELTPAQLTETLRARAQAELAAGLAGSLDGRLRFLCRQYRLPRRWCATLIPEATILPEQPD